MTNTPATFKQAALRRALLAASGKLPAFKLGGTWRFSRADIDSWIRQQAIQVREGAEKLQ